MLRDQLQGLDFDERWYFNKVDQLQQHLNRSMNAQCAQPACIYNCCNQFGQCPTSLRECVTKRNLDPVWVYIAVCVIVLVVIGGVLLGLEYCSRRKNRKQAKKRALKTQVPSPDQPEKQIQIQLSSQLQANDKQRSMNRQELLLNQVSAYRKTGQITQVLSKRKSDVFSTSRDSKLRETVEVYFSRRFSRILDQNQQ